VEANLQARAARDAIEQQTGKPITAAQAKKVFQTVEDALRSLGFTQKANGQWERKRSALERLLG
jgi:tRNA C32,U32 (ribose-2'-O)-methylase TrmJ